MHIESYFTFDERAQQWRDYQLEHGKDPIIKRGDGLGDWISKTRKVCTSQHWKLWNTSNATNSPMSSLTVILFALQKYLAFHQGKKAKITQDQIDRLTSELQGAIVPHVFSLTIHTLFVFCVVAEISRLGIQVAGSS